MNISSINFDAASSNAELKEAANALRQWLVEHGELSYFTFDQLCRDLGSHAPAEQFNRLLLRLVAAGDLLVKYRVKINEGEYSEEEYDSLEDIPDYVFDSSFVPVTVSEGRKVPAYVPAR